MNASPLTQNDLAAASELLRKAVELEKEAASLRGQAARLLKLSPPVLPYVCSGSAVILPKH